MLNYRIARGLPLKSADVVFVGITYDNCHENTGTMFKYLANYGFEKFGFEVFNLRSVRCVTFKTIFFIDNGSIRGDFDDHQDGRDCHINVVLVAVDVRSQSTLDESFMASNYDDQRRCSASAVPDNVGFLANLLE